MLNQDFLKDTVLFRDLSEKEMLEVVLIGHVKSYEAEKVIFKEGEPGDTIYFIIEGLVRISKMQDGGEEALAVLEPKSFFGEMTLFEPTQTRSAHAIAHEKCRVFAINANDLKALFNRNKDIGYKFLWAFCMTLTQRLRNTNEKFQVIMSLANSGF